MNIIVSACLLGYNCKYNGANNYSEETVRYIKDGDHYAIPVCPEILGGLNTPRSPAEITGGTVINRDGVCVDKEFRIGAERALETALSRHADMAILQPRSPSCGAGQIYDGTFSGTLIDGNGIFAQMLIDRGIEVKNADELKK